MTREEAKHYLSVPSSTNGSGRCTDEQHYEAKQIAIKALEQEPKIEQLRAEVERATIEMDYETAQEALAVIDRYMASSDLLGSEILGNSRCRLGRFFSFQCRLVRSGTDHDGTLHSLRS